MMPGARYARVLMIAVAVVVVLGLDRQHDRHAGGVLMSDERTDDRAGSDRRGPFGDRRARVADRPRRGRGGGRAGNRRGLGRHARAVNRRGRAPASEPVRRVTAPGACRACRGGTGQRPAEPEPGAGATEAAPAPAPAELRRGVPGARGARRTAHGRPVHRRRPPRRRRPVRVHRPRRELPRPPRGTPGRRHPGRRDPPRGRRGVHGRGPRPADRPARRGARRPGPSGAANLAIGIHTARQDSSPMFALVGQVERAFRGREAFQEIDQAATIGGLASHAVEHRPRSPTCRALVGDAVRAALVGRPGPGLPLGARGHPRRGAPGRDRRSTRRGRRPSRPEADDVRAVLQLPRRGASGR